MSKSVRISRSPMNFTSSQIGSTTCGKPYGFYPEENCGTTYFTIQFRGVNETISSLLMGYLAVALFKHFVEGPMRDPASLNKPSTLPLREDVLMGMIPGYEVHWGLLWGVLALCVLAMLFMRQRHFQPTERAMLLPDAIGLGLFAAVGVDIATAIGMPPIISVMMGVTTGVFGGVLRDVLCNEVPQAFSDHRPYALCAFAGGWADVALRQLQAPDWAPLLACVLLTAGLRGLALWRNWELPAWRV